MNKDAFYFPHDSNATNDPKIMMLISQWGLEAYGIYWAIVEHLREQPGYRSHLSILKALAMRYNSTEEKFQYVVRDFELFKIVDEMFFYSPALVKRMQPLEEKREKMRNLALKRWGKHKDNQIDNASALPMYIDTQCRRNASKVKKSKVKKSKVLNNNYSNEIKNFTALLTKYFPKSIIDNLATSTKLRWVDTIDKLIRLDNKSQEDIEKSVKFARNDDFWSRNFLSLTKLRRKDKDDIKYIDVFLHQCNGKEKKHTINEYIQNDPKRMEWKT